MMGFNGIYWDLMGFTGIYWDLMGFNGVYTMGFDAIYLDLASLVGFSVGYRSNMVRWAINKLVTGGNHLV